MSEHKSRMPEEISLPFIGRVSLTAVVVHFAGADMRLRGISDGGTELRLNVTNSLEGGALPGVPRDIPVGSWKLYYPELENLKSTPEMTSTEAVLEVSPETYSEIRSKLIDADYGHLALDGYVSMSGLAIAPPAEDVVSAEPAVWPAGCLKPRSCVRNGRCMYGRSGEQCRHFGRDLSEVLT